MTTHAHDSPLKLCRERPEFALELVGDLLGIPIPDHDEVVPYSESATDQEVRDLNCDNVVVCRKDGDHALAVIVEVQRGKDDDKLFSWPAYQVNIRQRTEAPTALVCICPTKAVANRATKAIETGHPGFVFRPLVLGPDNYPRLFEPSGTGELAEQMVVGTLIHGTGRNAEAIFSAVTAELAFIPKDRAARYAEYMLGQLTERPRTILEALMQSETYPYQSRLLAEREAVGGAREAEKAVLAIIEARGLPITENQRRRIESCEDLTQLRTWVKRAAVAPTVSDVLS